MNKKIMYWWGGAMGLACLVALVSQPSKEERPWQMGDGPGPKWDKLVERQLKYTREHPAPPPRVWTTEEQLESRISDLEGAINRLKRRPVGYPILPGGL